MIKRMFIWICIISIALNVFTYTFNVDVSYENAFNLLFGSFVELVGDIYGDIKNTLGWLWGDGSFMDAFNYITDITGLSSLWEGFLNTLPFID